MGLQGIASPNIFPATTRSGHRCSGVCQGNTEALQICLSGLIRLSEQVVSQAWNVFVQELRASARRAAPVARARQAAIYLTHVVPKISLAPAGRQFGRDRTTVVHACRQMEDLRDDPEIDFLPDRMAVAVRAMSEVLFLEEME